ncbi:hypothetical protein CsSME_00014885 [Camellia sinensis var. sinensis]
MRCIHSPFFETLILESEPFLSLLYLHISLILYAYISLSLSNEEDEGEHSRKKLRLSKDQLAVLEESFNEHKLHRLFRAILKRFQRFRAACVLLNLSLINENKISIEACGVIPPLITLLMNGSNRGKKDTMTTLYKLCTVKVNKERAVKAVVAAK